MMNQAGLGNVLTAAGHHRLARRQVRAAVAAAEQTTDPVAVTWTQIVASLHWLGVGDWPALDAGLPRAPEAGSRGGLHRAADQAVLLGGVCRYLTGRFGEAAAMRLPRRAAGRDRHDRMVQLWGLGLVLAESRLTRRPGRLGHRRRPRGGRAAPDQRDRGRRPRPLPCGRVARLLAAGRTPDAWREISAAAALAGPEPSFAPYTLEAHAGIPDVRLALLEQDKAVGIDLAEVRATAAAGLRRYARIVPHGLAPSACLPRLDVGLAPRPPRGRPQNLDAGPSGRPSGSPCPGSWPTPTTSSAAI